MDSNQFIQLVTEEQEGLRRFLLVLCDGDGPEADDLAQEALLKAFLAIDKFEGRSKFSTWLYRIACNCFYDKVRKQSKIASTGLDGEARFAVAEEPSENKFEYNELYRAVNGLPVNEKAAVVLFYREEKSIKEISAIMGMPEGTIKTHLHRGKMHLKEKLSHD